MVGQELSNWETNESGVVNLFAFADSWWTEGDVQLLLRLLLLSSPYIFLYYISSLLNPSFWP